MDKSNIVVAKNDYYNIIVDKTINRAYFIMKGYWKDIYCLNEYISDIKYGLQNVSEGFTVLVDMTEYIGSASSVFKLHVEVQQIVVAGGVKRIAEVYHKNPLLKMFSEAYAKESGAIEMIMSFDEKHQAERWLDMYR